jgi:hypothetical protein
MNGTVVVGGDDIAKTFGKCLGYGGRIVVGACS